MYIPPHVIYRHIIRRYFKFKMRKQTYILWTQVHACLLQGGHTLGASHMSRHRGERDEHRLHCCNQSWQPLTLLVPLNSKIMLLLQSQNLHVFLSENKNLNMGGERWLQHKLVRAPAQNRKHKLQLIIIIMLFSECESMWGMHCGTLLMNRKAFRACPARKMSIHTKLSLCHTFLLSLTQSMLGGMVSRATERHLSLTTVQNAEMEDISLHLRCGNIGAYSSTTSRTKPPWPRKPTMQSSGKTQVNENDSRTYIRVKQQMRTEISKKQLFWGELCSFWFCS